MKYLSLFSGIGGFELGIKQAYENSTNKHERPNIHQGHSGDSQGRGERKLPTCIGYSEIDKYAIQIYQKHFPTHKAYGDITKINPATLPDFDLLVGGFPCQSFSIAGKRGGFDDTRGTLFFEIARIIREKQPRLLLLENVKGLLSHDKGATFATILSTLDELGYSVEWQVLNSKNFGVPQNRERVFIIGHLRGGSGRKIFPIGESPRGNINSGIIGGTLTARYPASQREGAYIEEARNGTAKIRKLTPKECERLQGFPDGWTAIGKKEPDFDTLWLNGRPVNLSVKISDTQRYKCLGNAVTVNVIEAIISKL